MENKEIAQAYEYLFKYAYDIQDDDINLFYINKILSKNKSINILDAGCGNGRYSFYFAKLGYKNLFAVDLFENIQTSLFEYSRQSLDNLNFKDNFFDTIYSNSVIYYAKNPNDFVAEFSRILKQNGYLMFTCHTKYSIHTLYRIIKRDVFHLKSMNHLKGVKFYSAHYYKKLLEQNGFEVILQDGFELSFVHMFYKRVANKLKRVFGIQLPIKKLYFNNGRIGKIKSEVSYHMVFIARKK